MERDSSIAAEHGWYIAEPDGTTVGPFTRSEFASQRARGGFSPQALAWHVDFAEWRPLARIAVTERSRAGEASRERAAVRVEAVAEQAQSRAAQAQSRAAPNKAERKAARKAATQVATPKSATLDADDGRRLLQGAALARAAARPAAPTGAKPAPVVPNQAAAAASANAARVGLALRRFGARILDTLTLGMVGACALYALAWRELDRLDPPSVPLLLWLAVFAVVPLAALCLAIAGRTPGKALFGVETRTPGGGNPSFAAALRREIDVAWRGMGLGVPVLGLITVVIAGAKLANEGETTWDRNQRLTTRAAGGMLQAALIALVVALYLLGSSLWTELVFKLLAP